MVCQPNHDLRQLKTAVASLAFSLAGCASTLPVAPESGLTALSAQRLIPLTLADPRPDVSRRLPAQAWMSPDARGARLLYVSDWFGGNGGVVEVYNYLTRREVGELVGFNGPDGLCSDPKGNVYITEFNAQEIVEYAHGGTSPIKSLGDAYGFPNGCSVDPVTGNLAVSNYESPTGSQYGGVLVYLGALGEPIPYQGTFYHYWSPGYDPHGDLFVEGTNNGMSGIAELFSGSPDLTVIDLKQTITFPGGVMWDGKYVAAADQEYEGQGLTAIYRISVSGLKGKVEGTTVLYQACGAGGPHSDVPQPLIVAGGPGKRATVVGGNLQCLDTEALWAYPRGGYPPKTLHDPPYSPLGQALSDAP